MKLSDPVAVAIIVAVAPTVTSIGSCMVAVNTSAKVDSVEQKVEVVHKATNSLTDRLVTVTRSDALQEGHAEGVADEKARTLPNRIDQGARK